MVTVFLKSSRDAIAILSYPRLISDGVDTDKPTDPPGTSIRLSTSVRGALAITKPNAW